MLNPSSAQPIARPDPQRGPSLNGARRDALEKAPLDPWRAALLGGALCPAV
jgi:hypothetical protein